MRISAGPASSQIFRSSDSPGLTDLLLDEHLDVADLLIPTEQAGLRLLLVGKVPPNPAELVGSNRMAALVESVRALADVVIIDSPPLRLVADAALLAQDADGTIVVVDAGHTPTKALEESVETLHRAGVQLLGVVLNRVPGVPSSPYATYGAQEAAGSTGAALASTAGQADGG